MKERCLAALLIVLLLSGCGSGSAKETVPSAGLEQAETVEADGAMTAEQTEKEARSLTVEEVLAAYDQAVEAYSWFDLTPLPAAGTAVELDGGSYLPVDRQGMSTMLELRTYLRGLFSEEVTDQLLETGGSRPLYREVDGTLYVRANSGREKDPYKGGVNAQVKQENETSYAVNVTVDLLDGDRREVTGVECYAFPYQWVEDRWVFTQFQLVY
ncbi:MULTISPECIES: hypothetical protein [environmental samples]|uniref:hypothetical protein n=1 Tax=environmental samples TaxID=876090 RepID=UPI0003368DE6|nr:MULTISPECIES: hypothetical protein [environmental samples]CDC68703.1 putative uncharacterized protein [Oscillibacter sp. CAG:155]